MDSAHRREWNAKTVVKFVGWKPCGTDPVDVKLHPIGSAVTACPGSPSGQICVDDAGTRGKGKSAHFNILFGDEVVYMARYKRETPAAQYDPNKALSSVWVPALCLEEAKAAITNPTAANEAAFVQLWQGCLENIMLHELGHIAGFAHEQYRKDDPAKQQACLADFGSTLADLGNYGEYEGGDLPLGPFDSNSIMSYCRRDRSATLTAQDIQQTNEVYAKLAPKIASDKPALPPPGDDDAVLPDDPGEPEAPAPKPPRRRTTTTSGGGCNG